MTAPTPKLCANRSFPHTGIIHAHGYCQACRVFSMRNRTMRPAFLIQADLHRKERVRLTKTRKQLAARHEVLAARLARKAVA